MSIFQALWMGLVWVSAFLLSFVAAVVILALVVSAVAWFWS